MDFPRIALILCVFLLAVCLVFSISALTVLRNAVSEADQVRKEAQELLADFEEQLREQEELNGQDPADPSIPVDVLYDNFCMRESGGRIAIYTSDGYLVRILDVMVDTLPESDRKALQDGISVSSWKELLALIQDYTG